MKKDEITIVTAFFDIGRKDFKSIPRSNEKYVEYFKFWARIKNNLIVYTDSVMAESVKKVRKEFGLLNKTKVIIIDDISTIEPEILEKMQLIEKNKYFLSFRYYENATENNSLYNYVMLLKSWCIKDSVEKGYAKGQIAWLDFGYNHGGKIFTNEKEFDFEWKYKFADKITYFINNKLNDEPIFYLIQSFNLSIMGAPFIVPDYLAREHWNLMKQSLEELINCGFMDDDQILMIMSYRKKPEIFDLKNSNWFMPIKDYGGNHLTIKNNANKISLKDRLLYKYRVHKRNKKYLKRFKKEFLKDYLD